MSNEPITARPRLSRHLSMNLHEAADLGDALAWALNTVDTEMVGANMIRVSVEQIMRSGDDEDGWRFVWTASVSGMFDEVAGNARRDDQ